MPNALVGDLTFQSKDLGTDTTLLLTFDSDMPGMYKDYFPVAWRVTTFGKDGSYSMLVTYEHQFALSKSQVDDGNITGAATGVEINLGQQTTLTKNGQVFSFSTPQAGLHGTLEAINNTGENQDITVGFMIPGQFLPKPALFFDNIKFDILPLSLLHQTHSATYRNGSKITAQFTPKLRAYITSEYQEGAILRDAIQAPPIWVHDLTALEQSTTWNLTRDPATGHYTITRA
ncbi:hypothetical protein EDB19DRAFT_1913574 [Suillus lakei]|nr:hypothetical protein EDB19DRAFT_1913574 [Suillus lakei]